MASSCLRNRSNLKDHQYKIWEESNQCTKISFRNYHISIQKIFQICLTGLQKITLKKKTSCAHIYRLKNIFNSLDLQSKNLTCSYLKKKTVNFFFHTIMTPSVNHFKRKLCDIIRKLANESTRLSMSVTQVSVILQWRCEQYKQYFGHQRILVLRKQWELKYQQKRVQLWRFHGETHFSITQSINLLKCFLRSEKYYDFFEKKFW